MLWLFKQRRPFFDLKFNARKNPWKNESSWWVTSELKLIKIEEVAWFIPHRTLHHHRIPGQLITPCFVYLFCASSHWRLSSLPVLAFFLGMSFGWQNMEANFLFLNREIRECWWLTGYVRNRSCLLIRFLFKYSNVWINEEKRLIKPWQ